MTRRPRWAVLLAAGVIVLAVAGITAAVVAPHADRAPTAPSPTWDTAAVRRGTLAVESSIDGTVGFGPVTPLTSRTPGVVTWLPAAGTVVEPGEVLFRADDEPVVLLHGSIPMYRPIRIPPPGTASDSTQPDPDDDGDDRDGPDGSGGGGGGGETTPGPDPASPTTQTPRELTGRDVAQLEQNLAALGYRGFDVDSTFTRYTELAVKRWQLDLGRRVTGQVAVGDVVFLPRPVRIEARLVKLGSPATGDLLSTTGLQRTVVAQTTTADDAWTRGARVAVDLGSGRRLPGRISSLSETTEESESMTLSIAVSDQRALGRVERGRPVTVTIVVRQRRNVLHVRVEALVALAGGGYGVQTVDGTYLPCRTGMFADGHVEVSGTGIHVGLDVRIPR